MDLKGRKVKMFRCHIDPMIPPRPANAFMMTDPSSPIAEAVLGDIAVCVTLKAGGPKHIVPYSNVQSITLMPDEPEHTSIEPKVHPLAHLADKIEKLLQLIQAKEVNKVQPKSEPVPKPVIHKAKVHPKPQSENELKA